MSGDEVDGYGGLSDGGAAAEGWRLALRLDDAREAFAEAEREKATSPLLAALLARLNAPRGGGVR